LTVLQPTIPNLPKRPFSDALFDPDSAELEGGAGPERDSFTRFELFLLIEEACAIRFSTDEKAALKGIPASCSSLSAKVNG
jgi:hypothetical protein